MIVTVGAPVLYLSACDEGPIPLPPSASTVDQLERRLAEHPCVGPLARWERNYTHQSEPFLLDQLQGLGPSGWQLARWYDYKTIVVDFREPGIAAPPDWGIETSAPGRRVHAMVPRYESAIIGDQGAAGDGVSGTYDIPSGRLHLWWSCGRFQGFPARER